MSFISTYCTLFGGNLGLVAARQEVNRRHVEFWDDDACVEAEEAVRGFQATPEQQGGRRQWSGDGEKEERHSCACAQAWRSFEALPALLQPFRPAFE